MSEKRRSGLVLHSDQGTRYTSYAYHVLTKEYNITLSMSRRGNCLDNAVIENFFGHLKEEAMRQVPNPIFEDARQMIDAYNDKNNNDSIIIFAVLPAALVGANRCFSTHPGMTTIRLSCRRKDKPVLSLPTSLLR